MNVPKTAEIPERTGSIIDYLAFLRYNNVIPVLQESLVCMENCLEERSIDDAIRIHGFYARVDSLIIDGNHFEKVNTLNTVSDCTDVTLQQYKNDERNEDNIV